MTTIAKLLPYSLPLAMSLAVGCDAEDTTTPDEASLEADAPPNALAAVEAEDCDDDETAEHVDFMLASYDVDAGGTLSLSEAKQTWLSARFAEADADDNGDLTSAELINYKKDLHKDDGLDVAVIEKHVAEVFGSLDTDETGTLTRSEAQQTWLAARFATADRNGDGSLAQDELLAFKVELHKGDDMPKATIEGHVEQVFATLDADDGGTLSIEEAGQTGLAASFELVDDDGNGELSRDELTALAAKHSDASACAPSRG